MLSKETVESLQRAGWRPGRVVPNYEKTLEAEGYTVCDLARTFLASYGGLTITVPHHSGGMTTFHFDVGKVAKDSIPENVHYFESLVGESLIPVGQAFDGYMEILLAESGRVYAAYDDLFLVGENPDEALNTLCSGKQLEGPIAS